MVDQPHRPLALYRYRLTTIDALAFERLPGEWTGRQKLAFILSLMFVGALAGFLEESSGIWWWAAVGGLLLLWAAAGLAFRNWHTLRRARALAAREGETQVEEWSDHLLILSQQGSRRLGYEDIGKVIATDAHVFILHRGGVVIVPLRAFDTPEAMQAFAEAVDTRSIRAAP